MRKRLGYLLILAAIWAVPAHAHARHHAHHRHHHQHHHVHVIRAHSVAEGLGHGLIHMLESMQPRRGHFICGLTQRLYFGLPEAFNLALHWKVLRHVSAQPGAVVVQTRAGRALGGGPGGHVSRIVSLTGQCRAVVTDDRGTYERDICRNLVAYVLP